jgi:hypothetical protein
MTFCIKLTGLTPKNFLDSERRVTASPPYPRSQIVVISYTVHDSDRRPGELLAVEYAAIRRRHMAPLRYPDGHRPSRRRRPRRSGHGSDRATPADRAEPGAAHALLPRRAGRSGAAGRPDRGLHLAAAPQHAGDQSGPTPAPSPPTQAGGTEPKARWQPSDQVRREQSGRGAHRGNGAIRHWRKQLQEIPPSMFGAPTGPSAQPRFRRMRFESRALGIAAARLAASCQVSLASVVLAGTALGLSALTGQATCVLLIVTGYGQESARSRRASWPRKARWCRRHSPQPDDAAHANRRSKALIQNGTWRHPSPARSPAGPFLLCPVMCHVVALWTQCCGVHGRIADGNRGQGAV